MGRSAHAMIVLRLSHKNIKKMKRLKAKDADRQKALSLADWCFWVTLHLVLCQETEDDECCEAAVRLL